jgi:hypothetical protein
MTHVEIAVTIEKNVWKRLGEMSLDQEVVERLTNPVVAEDLFDLVLLEARPLQFNGRDLVEPLGKESVELLIRVEVVT